MPSELQTPSPLVSPPGGSVGTELAGLTEQAERLIALGLVGSEPRSDDRHGPGCRLARDDLRAAAKALESQTPAHSLLVLHERVAPPSTLAPLLRRALPGRAGAAGETRAGFVVVDMSDVDSFAPEVEVGLPDADVYAVCLPERGDEMRNWSPAEASAAIAAQGRTPLTLAEGIQWALQAPTVLEPEHCFMTIGSRLRRLDGTHDPRTPAVWISNGTGRDGRERRGAPKVGWCWWGNRHTWLGFASAAVRTALR